MTSASRTALDALEVFARAVETLKRAEVDVDVAELAELYDVAWPGADDDEEVEPTAEELAEAHRRRTESWSPSRPRI